MNDSDIVCALSALAQEVRLRLFRALVVSGPQGLTPGALAAQFEVAPNTLSFHLKELTHSGLVNQERQGRHLIYRVSFDQMNQVLAYLTQNCCQGQTCLNASTLVCDGASVARMATPTT